MSYQSVFAPDLFKGQTVIVTGGGSGIGRCTAHELAALGANVVIVGRSVEKLDQVSAEIREDGGEVFVQTCDIRDEESVGNVIDAVLEKYGKIDALVNNAGGQYRTAMETISTKGFEAVVRNNLTGGFIFMREVYTRWMKANGGNIVNMIADIWNGWPDFSHSGAARGGMLTLSESVACEWGADNVRVTFAADGTPQARRLHSGDTHRKGAEATLRPPILLRCSIRTSRWLRHRHRRHLRRSRHWRRSQPRLP